MSEMTAPGSPAISREQEEEAFYHEAGLNRSWTGIRLGTAVFASGIGAFLFAYFYLRSLNSYGNWYPKGFSGPALWQGVLIYGMVVVSAVLQTLGLSRIKAGSRSGWSSVAWIALALGLAAGVLQIVQLAALQQFQAGLSAFTFFWNFMAIVAIVFWVLFYVVH